MAVRSGRNADWSHWHLVLFLSPSLTYADSEQVSWEERMVQREGGKNQCVKRVTTITIC